LIRQIKLFGIFQPSIQFKEGTFHIGWDISKETAGADVS
jgi:hypothetical protein